MKQAKKVREIKSKINEGKKRRGKTASFSALSKDGKGKAILEKMIGKVTAKSEASWSDWDKGGWDKDVWDKGGWDRDY